jgi:hypothetical protein
MKLSSNPITSKSRGKKKKKLLQLNKKINNPILKMGKGFEQICPQKIHTNGQHISVFQLGAGGSCL